MFQDFKELLSAFNAHGVKYLIVGGYAVSFHAQPRATKDIDLFVKADAANAKAAYAALASFGAPLDNISVEDLADPRNFIRFGREPVASIFCLVSTVLILIPHGKGGSRASSIRKAASWRLLFPRAT